MLTDGIFVNYSKSMMAEFDRKAAKLYPVLVDKKVKRTVQVGALVEKSREDEGHAPFPVY